MSQSTSTAVISPAAQTTESVVAVLNQAWPLFSKNPKQALELTESVLKIAEDMTDKTALGYAQRNLGFSSFLASDYQAALSHLLRGMEIANAIDDLILKRDCLNYVAGSYSQLGDYDLAMEHSLEVWSINKDLNDERGISASLLNIGVLHQNMRQHKKALEFLEEGLEASRRHNNPNHKARALINIGLSHVALKDYELAAKVYEEALQIGREIGETTVEAQALANLGEAHDRMGNYAKAMELTMQALDLARNNDIRAGEAFCLHYLGVTLLHMGKNDEATLRLREALAVAEEISLRPQVAKVHKALFEVHRAKNELDLALEHHVLFHDMEMETRDQTMEGRTKAMMVRLEVDRARAQSEIYKLRNVELASALEALETANLQKSVLVDQLREQSVVLEKQVREDPLTALFNRRFLELSLGEEFARARALGRQLTVSMMDIDHFKSINDGFSHQVGDEVLRRVADIMRKNSRGSDIVARYGGEEFVLVMPGLGAESAFATCERLRLAVQTYPWDIIHPNLKVTISIGLSSDLSVSNYEKLLNSADEKMYESKHTGRNKVCF